MPSSILAPGLRVLALLALLAALVTVATAPAHPAPTLRHTAGAGGPLCCGGGN